MVAVTAPPHTMIDSVRRSGESNRHAASQMPTATTHNRHAVAHVTLAFNIRSSTPRALSPETTPPLLHGTTVLRQVARGGAFRTQTADALPLVSDGSVSTM